MSKNVLIYILFMAVEKLALRVHYFFLTLQIFLYLI